MKIVIRRLGENDAALAARVTQVMAQVFEEGTGSTPEQVAKLLSDERCWLFGAFADDEPVGGLSAHVLPMTRQHGAELFVYDIAVAVVFQRQGIGRQLMQAAVDAASQAGLLGVFVPAESDDPEALAFYRRIGGAEQSVSIFNF